MLTSSIRLALLATGLVTACGDADGPGANDGAGASSATTAGAGATPSGGAGGGANGGTGANAGGAGASTGGDSSSGGAGADGPEPPPGSTLCGSGTFTAGDALQACGADPNTATLPPAACDLLGVEGGAWEVWCSPTTLVYFWIRFDGASVPDPDMTLTLDGGLPQMPMDLNGATAVGTNVTPLTPRYVTATEADVSLDFDMEEHLSGDVLPLGSGNLWVTGMYSDGSTVFDQRLVSGAAFVWSIP